MVHTIKSIAFPWQNRHKKQRHNPAPSKTWCSVVLDGAAASK
jgi:hypothetical protein